MKIDWHVVYSNEEGKPRKISASIAGLSADIRTRDVSNKR